MCNYDLLLAMRSSACECKDLEEFIDEEGGAVPTDDPDTAIAVLTAIWQYAGQRSGSAVISASGMGQSEFSREMGLPLRTVQNWAGGQHDAPEWACDLLMSVVIGRMLD